MYRLLLILLLICQLLTGCSRVNSTQANTGARADVPLPPVVATVNGCTISNKLFVMYLMNGRESLGIDPATEKGRRQLEQLKEGIVSELIDRALIAQEAGRRGLSIPPDRLGQAESRHVAQLGGDRMFDAYLVEHQFTRDEYRSVIENTVYGELLRDELSKDLQVSDDEVRAYLEKNQNDRAFQQPETVEAARPATLAEAAPEIRRRLLAERRTQTLNNWLKEARRTVSIKINEPYRFGELKKEFPAM